MSGRNWAEIADKPHVYVCENTCVLKYSFYKFGNSGVLHYSCVFIQNWILPLEFFQLDFFHFSLDNDIIRSTEKAVWMLLLDKTKIWFWEFSYMLNLQQVWLLTSRRSTWLFQWGCCVRREISITLNQWGLHISCRNVWSTYCDGAPFAAWTITDLGDTFCHNATLEKSKILEYVRGEFTSF